LGWGGRELLRFAQDPTEKISNSDEVPHLSFHWVQGLPLPRKFETREGFHVGLSDLPFHPAALTRGGGGWTINPLMARITVEDCLENIPNRFELVLGAARRAKQLLKGARPLVESDNKEVVTALREIAAGKVTIEEPDA